MRTPCNASTNNAIFTFSSLHITRESSAISSHRQLLGFVYTVADKPLPLAVSCVIGMVALLTRIHLHHVVLVVTGTIALFFPYIILYRPLLVRPI